MSHTYVVGTNQAKLRALAATGRVEVGLLAPRRWRDQQLGMSFKLEDATEGLVRLFPAPIVLAGRVGGYVFSPSDLVKAVRAFRPDVVHVEAELFSLVALEVALVARTLAIPFTLFCWENVERDLGPRLVNTRLVTSSVSHLLAGSTDAAELARRWGYRGEVTVVPQLGIAVKPDLSPRAFPDARPRVGFVGRLAHHKGVDLLLRALADLVRRGIEAQAVIIGTGPLEAELQKLAADLRISDRVLWRGWVPHEEVPRALGSVDLLVLPSRSVLSWREQFGHVLIEAMAEGIPVVGSSCGAIPDVIGNPELIFPEEDHASLGELLARLLTDPQRYEEAARHSVSRVRGFTNEAIAECMVPIWEEIAEKARTRKGQGGTWWLRR